MSKIESLSTSVVPPSGPSPSSGDPAMAELLELFEGPLREVAFPDVSRDALRVLAGESEAALARRAVRAGALAEAEEMLARAQAAVAACGAALRAAEAEVDERQRALLARGQRALSYAKVFAESDPDLHARLSAISLVRIAQRGKAPPRALALAADAPRKRGRPRKVEPMFEPVDVSVSS